MLPGQWEERRRGSCHSPWGRRCRGRAPPPPPRASSATRPSAQETAAPPQTPFALNATPSDSTHQRSPPTIPTTTCKHQSQQGLPHWKCIGKGGLNGTWTPDPQPPSAFTTGHRAT
eukprot:1182182-Prorocentrum_minimum.AAC.2